MIRLIRTAGLVMGILLLGGCMQRTTTVYQTIIIDNNSEVCTKEDGLVADIVEYEDIGYTLECYPVGGDEMLFIDVKPVGSRVVEKTIEDGRPTTGKMIIYNGEQYMHCK